jgi:lysylphosphatidylglycerol synthetase-like protein (DUF2156 family)
MNKRPITITISLVLMALSALVWLVFGLSIVTGLHPTIAFDNLINQVMAILSLLCASVLSLLVIFLARRSKLAYWVSVPLLALVAIFSLADELGFADLASFLVSTVALVCLVAGRRWFFIQN